MRLAARGRAAVDSERRPQPVLAVLGRVLQDGERRLQLRLDDVGEPPGAARPGSGEVGRRAARVVLGAATLELLRLHLERGRDPCRRGLGEDAHAAVGVGVGAGRRPGVEERPRHDPGETRGRESRRHVAAERAHRCRERGVDVGLPRVGEGRDEQACAARTHLVHVVHDLRVPAVVEVAQRELRLLLREHVPVAVVVVADVGLVEQRRARALERRPQLLPVPLAHDVGPVRVVRGDHEQHGRVEHRAHVRVVARREPVQQPQRRERPADLGRVDRVGHRDDRLAVAHQALGLRVREAARVCEPRVRSADLLEPRMVRLRRHRGDHERSALRGLADLLDAHASGCRVERAEVAEHLPPIGELAILARDEAEHSLGRRNTRRSRGLGRKQRRGHEGRRRTHETGGAPKAGGPEHRGPLYYAVWEISSCGARAGSREDSRRRRRAAAARGRCTGPCRRCSGPPGEPGGRRPSSRRRHPAARCSRQAV